MADWSFLTNHAPVLLCIAHDPSVRPRYIAARPGVTERTIYGIVTDRTEAGYVVKHRIILVASTEERHRRRRHLVTPGTVITPQSASADGRPVPSRADVPVRHACRDLIDHPGHPAP